MSSRDRPCEARTSATPRPSVPTTASALSAAGGSGAAWGGGRRLPRQRWPHGRVAHPRRVMRCSVLTKINENSVLPVTEGRCPTPCRQRAARMKALKLCLSSTLWPVLYDVSEEDDPVVCGDSTAKMLTAATLDKPELPRDRISLRTL